MWNHNGKIWYSEEEYQKLQNRIKLLKKIMTDNIRKYRNKNLILEATVQSQNLVKIVEEFETLKKFYNDCEKEYKALAKRYHELQAEYNILFKESQTKYSICSTVKNMKV